MKFKSNIELQAGLEDNNAASGTSGQVLSSTGTGVEWIDQSAISSASNFVYFNVKNETGSTINKGKGVMAVGTDGNSGHILIDEMVADGSIESKYFLGVLETTVANGGFARVISFGQLDQFDTRGQNGETWLDGQVLWCDPNSAGDFTITEPDGPNVKIAAAIILNASTNGKIQVRVQANEGIHDLHDTKIASQVDGDVLVWDDTTGVWFNDSTLNVDYNNGRVGIGTTVPGTTLTVSGIITAAGGNSTQWNTAYSDRNKWDGGATGLNAANGRISLGLGALATLNTVDAATITDNSVGAAELNVTGNGTTSQYLRSDGDGTFTWATPTDTTYGVATDTTLGLIELFSDVDQTVAANTVTTTAGRTYGIQLNSANQAVVNVPWTDTNTTYTAGGGLTLSGTTFSHTDTSSQASVNNSNGVVIQDVTLDTYGHVTGLASVDLDGRYYTETESDSRFVNVTGDTMTGSLIVDTPGDYDSTVVTSLTSAPINVPEVDIGTTAAFLPFLHQKARYASGYRTHMNLGLYKNANAWGDGETGFYIALGGNDSYPTEYFRMTFGGAIKHSNGSLFWNSGNDGAGSGLDADLLDGQHASAFQLALTNPVTGTGTTNYLPKFTGSTTLGNSLIYDNGTNVGIGTTTPEGKLQVGSFGLVVDQLNDFVTGSASSRIFTTSGLAGGIRPAEGSHLVLQTRSTALRDIIFATGTTPTERMTIKGGGNVGIGTTSPYSPLQVGDYTGTAGYSYGTAATFVSSFSTTRPTLMLMSTDNTATQNKGGSIAFGGGSENTSSPYTYAQIKGAKEVAGAGYSGYMAFYTTPSGSDANTERMRIDSSGNVGIGTTSPSAKLDVIGDVKSSVGFSSKGTTRKYFWDIQNTGNSGTIWKKIGVFYAADQSSRIMITATGTTSYGSGTKPGKYTVLAQVNNNNLLEGTYWSEGMNAAFGSFVFRSISGVEHEIYMEVGSYAEYALEAIISDGTFVGENTTIQATIPSTHTPNREWRVNNSLFVDSSGNVGIGTTSPSTKLHVYESSPLDHITIDGNNGDNRNLRFATENSTRWNIYATGTAESGSNVGSDLSFTRYSDTGAYLSNAMLIQRSTGNVGIGTISPTSILHLSASSPKLQFTGTGLNRTSSIGMDDGANFYIKNTSEGNLYISENNNVFLAYGGSSGNVGIGTTSPGYKLDVNGSLHSTYLTIADAIYHEGDTNTYIQFPTNDAIRWVTNGAERMRLDSAGGLGINTSTITSGRRLDVNGNALIRDNIYIGASGGTNAVYSLEIGQNRSGNGTALIDLSGDTTYGGDYSLRIIRGSTGANATSEIIHRGTGNFSINTTENANIILNPGSGDVGIGITNPQNKLSVEDSITGPVGPTNLASIYGYNTSTDTTYANSVGVAGRARTANGKGIYGWGENGGYGGYFDGRGYFSGNVGIGTTSPGYQLQLSANSAAKPTSNVWTVVSDRRVKENIRPYTSGLDKILQIEPKLFDYNGKAGFDKTKNNIGIIAQDMAEIMPETINKYKAKLNQDDELDTELYSFDGHAVTFALINSVKELQKQIIDLKSEIETLKNK